MGPSLSGLYESVPDRPAMGGGGELIRDTDRGGGERRYDSGGGDLPSRAERGGGDSGLRGGGD